MTATENSDTVRARAQQTFKSHLSLLQDGRIDEWGALFAEDCLQEHGFAPDGFRAVMTGRVELLSYMANFPAQLKVQFHDLQFHETLDPALVIAEFNCTGKALATGNPYNQRYISVVRTRDGLIVHYVDFWNPLVFMKAMGQGMNEAFQS